MKFNGNLLLSSALVATMSVMVACAPSKRGTKFADRTSANGKATDADRFFGKTTGNAESKTLQTKITYVDAMIEEAIDTKIAQAKLSKLAEDRSENKVSGLPEIKETERGEEVSDQSKIAPSNDLKNTRNPYLITVRLQIEDKGALDYMAFNNQFGASKYLVELLPANEACATKVASKISVRAACIDKACAQLAVEIVDESKEKVSAQLFMAKAGESTGSEIKLTKFEKYQSALVSKASAVAADQDEEATAISAATLAKPKMACSVEAAVASDDDTASEATLSEVKAKADKDKEEADKAKEEEAKKKADSESAIDDVAAIPE